MYKSPALLRALDEFQPDVVLHEQEVYTLSAGQIAEVVAQRRIPLVMFVWENVQRRLSWPRRALRRYVLDRCSGLLVGSEGARAVHQAWGYNGPLKIVPQMGVSHVTTTPVFGRRNGKAFHVAFAGRLVAEKGVDCLIRAVALLRQRRVEVCCQIAGQGPEMPKLMALVEQLQIREAVDFIGAVPRPEVLRLLSNSDVLVLPSRRTGFWEEQFGRILVEAMAEATVTVGSRTGAISEVIGAKDLLFEEDNHVELADIIERLAECEALLASRQRQLLARVSEKYMDDRLAQERLAFLKSVSAWRRSSSRQPGGKPAALLAGRHLP
jgi:glycosyltransferase involved in cell wall biosynthesis